MREYRVAILGASGAVGEQMLRVLEERNFPVAQLKLLSSARSAGKTVPFRGEAVAFEEAAPSSFAGMDIVLGAAENDIAKHFAPHIKEAGAVFVDNSSAFRLDPNVPLIIPEINPEDAKQHQGIISNPNCSTIVALVAVNPLRKLANVQTLIASTYQAVSGAGAAGPVELESQIKALAAGLPIQTEVFPYQIAYNLIPQIGSFNEMGYSSEEMKMQNEGRKIMHLPELKVACTCIRVPVIRSHSISINLGFDRPVSVEEARAAIAQAPGVKLVDDPFSQKYPMPLDTSDQDIIFVGRVRKDLTNENGLALWCCGDQVRKGAATNTVQIAELLI